ncbi:MAG: TolC family protein [Steroidobacteraceae bacterium]
MLAGCATYSPQPLPSGADLARSVAPHGVAPLGMNAVATLAVLNNPTLRAARAAMHVAQAQAFAAGLLPDPQLTYSDDFVMDHVTSPTDPRFPEYDAYGLGLSIDLQALLTHASKQAAAKASLRQAELDLLWQEWQTVAQARTLYVQQSIAGERHDFLATAQKVYAAAYRRSKKALSQGNVTLEQKSSDLAVLLDVRAQLGVADRSLIQAQASLRSLLGVEPDVKLPLQPLGVPTTLSRSSVEADLARLPRTRPDLRALQAGYHAQEESVRTAILSQFPNFSLGITRARDVSDVHTTGFGATLTLPIFDRGRGQIAIQRATRAQLRAAYLARLDQASGQVWQLWREIRQLDVQRRDLERRVPQMRANVESAARAYEQGNFPAASYLTLVSAYLAAEATRATVFENLWSDSIALATVLGTQVEPVTHASAG